MRRRGNISLKLVAQLMVKAGFNHIITVDMHSKESQGFFDCAIDNLRASPFLIQYIQEFIPDYRNAVIVAKSPLAAKRATSYAERLKLGIAVIHGEAKGIIHKLSIYDTGGALRTKKKPLLRNQWIGHIITSRLNWSKTVEKITGI